MPKDSSTKRLLLIGGGHSHLVALNRLSRQQRTGLEITLVSPDTHSVYSGMVPGTIAGHYHHGASKTDLQQLCQRQGVNWHRGTMTQLHPEQKFVSCKDGSTLPFDVISLNIGSTTGTVKALDPSEKVLRARPVTDLIAHWQDLQARIQQRLQQQPDATEHICIVGGGAASIELGLAMHYRLNTACGSASSRIHWQLITASPSLLNTHSSRVQSCARRELIKKGFRISLSQPISEVERSLSEIRLTSDSGRQWTATEVIWATHASGHPWLADTGLACTDDGFVRVNRYLQSSSHPDIFAAGDVAHFQPTPLPKSGVYAVREGKILAENLMRQLRGEPLRPFKPQRQSLSLISLGDQRALASRGCFFASGHWVWRWKNRIDRQFIAQFHPTSE